MQNASANKISVNKRFFHRCQPCPLCNGNEPSKVPIVDTHKVGPSNPIKTPLIKGDDTQFSRFQLGRMSPVDRKDTYT